MTSIRQLRLFDEEESIPDNEINVFSKEYHCRAKPFVKDYSWVSKEFDDCSRGEIRRSYRLGSGY